MTVYLSTDGGYPDHEDQYRPYIPTTETVEEYVEEAVSYFGGQFHPGDPMFPRNIHVVVHKVKELKRNRGPNV